MRTSRKNKLFKVAIWVVIILLFNFLLAILLLQLPAVQTRLAKSVSRNLSTKTGFQIQVEKVDIRWFDKFTLQGLSVVDEEGNKLASLQEAELNYKLGAILQKNIRLDMAHLKGLDFTLQLHNSDTLNINVLLKRLRSTFKNRQKGEGILTIDQLTLESSNFFYFIEPDTRPKNKFNQKNFSFLDINARLAALVVKPDTFMIDILELNGHEGKTGTPVTRLSTNYSISPTLMLFDSLKADVGTSVLQGNMQFNYKRYTDLSHFIDSVEIIAHVDHSSISSKDLSLFTDYFDSINDRYVLAGDFKGEINDFNVHNLDVHFGKGSRLAGSAYFSGLPRTDETFIDLNLKNSKLIDNDIEYYVGLETFTQYNRFSQVQFDAIFTGYLEDFVAYGNFKTNLGTINTDINLKLAGKGNQATYSGKLKLVNFNLREYTAMNLLGQVSLEGELEGAGLTMESADFKFNGNISMIDARGYRYTGIKTNGRFRNEYFSGSLSINDPNIVMQTDNEIDLRNNLQKIMIKGKVEHANLDTLNLIPNIPVFHADINADFNGFNLDDLNGHINFENLYAENRNQQLGIEHLTVSSTLANGLRNLELISEKANVKIWGNFNFATAYSDLAILVRELKLNLLNNSDSLEEFYAQSPSASAIPYEINLDIKASNIDHFIKLFFPKLKLHNRTNLTGSFQNGVASGITLRLENDSLSYGDNTFITNSANLDLSKVISKPLVLASTDLRSSVQRFSNGGALKDLLLSAIWSDDHIDFNWYSENQRLHNVNDIYGEVNFYRDSTQIHFNNSRIEILDEDWVIQDNNSILFYDDKIQVSNLNLGSQDQLIRSNGIVGGSSDEQLTVTASNLDLSILDPLLPKQVSGRLSGQFIFSELYTTPTIVSNFYINSFYINQFLIGDIFSSNDWNNDHDLFDIQFTVNRSNSPVILVAGTFNPFNKAHALDLNASFMNSRLNMAEPFIETLFSDLRGNINGNVHITGALTAPVIAGRGTFNQAGIKVNYLNTFYAVTGEWKFDSAAIYLQNLVVTDVNKNIGYLSGKFNHDHFRNFSIDLKGSMDNLLVLNTKAGDNDLFYGSGIATGDISFTGPIEDITIRAKATSQRGTRIYIPIGGTESTELEDYITFVKFEDSLKTNRTNLEDRVKVTGLNLELDLDITEEAYTEIIFDITSGDIIRGRGNGNISMEIDTKGDFSMIGGYEFVSGGYNFTMYNIVNKEFEIKPKSRITWSGDPYGGIMDIDASYKVTTSLKPLVDTLYHSMSDLKRNYPTEVLLKLTGPLMTPDIGFDIVINDYPKSNVDLDTQIKGFLNTVAVDQQELNRQVFSLLILRKFSPPNSFSSTGSIGSSVSEFVSNQLSYWVSQVDDNLTIDMEVDLSKMDAEALKTFQLRVSYEFMDGKLIITRDGGFTDPNNEASVESIAGDWTLEYLLSDDGRLRVKLFNKTNYNQFNSSTGSDSQPLVSGGFSLIYTTSFDNFGDLFKRKKKKKERKGEKVSSAARKPDENRVTEPQ